MVELPPGDGPRIALPARGLYYRRGAQRYIVRQQDFARWRLGPYAAWLVEPLRGGGELRIEGP